MNKRGTVLLIFLVSILAVSWWMPAEALVAGDGWLPWSEEEPAFRTDIVRPNFSVTNIAGRSGLTPAELETMLGKMSDLVGVFQRASALDPPRGVEIEPARHILPRHDETGRARALLWLIIWAPSREQAGHFSSQIEVIINEMLAGKTLIGEDAQGKMYLPPPLVGEVGGYSVYQLYDRETVLIITHSDRSPWLPVSQERWIQYTIDNTRAQLDEYQEEAVAKHEHALASFIDYFEQLYEQFDSWQEVPELAEIYDEEYLEGMLEFYLAHKKELELNIELAVQAVAALEAQDYDRLEELGERPLAMMGRTLLLLEEELELLSQEERKAPAYGLELAAGEICFPRWEPERTSLLLDPDDERAQPLTTPNTDFYRSDLPATAVQSLVIVQKAPTTQSWQDLMEEIRQTLDLEALAAMLE